MKKYLPLLNLILLTILTCFGFYLWYRLNIISLELVSQNSNLVKSNVGMDWVIGLINSNFGILITFVTVLFGMLGVITFVSIREKFKFTIERLTESFEKERDEGIVYKRHIKSIEGDLSFEMGKNINKDLFALNDKPDKNIDDYKKLLNFHWLFVTIMLKAYC